jgi:hypothetical protein
MDWSGVADKFLCVNQTRDYGIKQEITEFDLGTGYNSHTRDYGISSSVLK